MTTFFQWVHLTAAVVGVGGIGFLVLILLPSVRFLNPDQRDLVLRTVSGRFRWASWSVILLLLISGLYNVRVHYWRAPWGLAWGMLTIKIALALLVFAISLCLTLPLGIFDRFRARRGMWLSIAFALAQAVILISAYLRGS